MTEVTKSSDEILTELFDSFKTEAAVDVSDHSVTPKSPKDEPSRSKKKRKKDKKHKSDEKDKHRKKKKCKRHKKKESSNQGDKSSRPKKKKKRKFSSDSYDSEVEPKQITKILNVESCNKENNLPEEKNNSEVAVSNLSSVVNNFPFACDTSSIPLPPTIGDSILTPKVAQEVPEVKKPQVSEVFEKHAENVGKPVKKLFLQGLDKPKMSIKIGNLKNSHVLEAAEEAKIKADKFEEGEITDETSEESTKLLMKTETEATSENGSGDGKKQKLHSDQKKCRKRTKSDSSNINTTINTDDNKSDENKCNKSEGNNGQQIHENSFVVNEALEKVNKKSNENESSKNTIFDNKNQLKLKKLRQLRERKLDNTSSEDESINAAKSPSTKSNKDDSKKIINKSKKRSKLKPTSDSDRSSSTSESSSSLDRTKSSKSKEETTTSKDVKTLSKLTINSVSRRNYSPKTKRRKSKSKSRERNSRSISYSRTRVRRSRSRSRVRRSRTPKKYYRRKSRSASKQKKSPSPHRVKNKKSRSPRAKTRRSCSPSVSRSKRSRSLSRSTKRNSRSRGRKSSRSPSKLFSSKLGVHRSSSRSNIRSTSRNRSVSESRHSRSENRRSRSNNKRSTKRCSRSRDSQSRSKQSVVKSLKGKKERSARSSSSKHSYSKLSESASDKSDSDTKYKASKKKKSKDKKSHSKKHKSKHKDINSRLLALSSTKVESSSEDTSSDSESDDNDNIKKKSSKAKNLNSDKIAHTDDKKSKTSKVKKDLKKKAKDKIDSGDSSKNKMVKEVNLVEDSDDIKPKINLKQKIHYSLIDDEPIAMTESEMKILNAKNKISKSVNPTSTSSNDLSAKNFVEKDVKNKDLSSFKRLKSKQENKNSDLDLVKNTSVKSKSEDQLQKLVADETKKVINEYSTKKTNKIDDVKHKGNSEDLFKNIKVTEISSKKSIIEDLDKTEKLEDSFKSKTDEIVECIPAEVACLKNEEKNKNKIQLIEKKDSLSDKGNAITKTKNSLKEDKDSESEIELPLTANSYDSDGQRSDTAMRNIFFGSQSCSDSPDPEDESSTKKGNYRLSNNDSNSSEESDSESDNEKTFFGISKDHVENNYEAGSKTEPLAIIGNHPSDSNESSIDKNITDSDEELAYGKKQIPVKFVSGSSENTNFNKGDLEFEKSNHSLKDHLTVVNCNIQSVDCDSNARKIKVPLELIKESSPSLITSNDPTSLIEHSTCSKESSDKKNDILLDLSPRRTNSQDFLYEYGKSEIEDEKLDFDEDKSSESDVTLPTKIKEDIEVLNQKEKSDLTDCVTRVNVAVDNDEDKKNKVVKDIKEDISSTVMLEKLPAGDRSIVVKEDVSSEDMTNLGNEKLSHTKIVTGKKNKEITCNQISLSDTQILFPKNNETLDIPVPSIGKSNDLRIPIPCDDIKKELNDLNKSESESFKHIDTKNLEKLHKTAISDEDSHSSNFTKEKESVMQKTYDSICDASASPLPVEDNKPKVTTSQVKSVSRSRSRSKINKRSSNSERSRSVRETSSSRRSKSKDRSLSRRSKSKDRSLSRRSKSKDRSLSRRSKSKEKLLTTRKVRSKSPDKRSRSKGRHSRSKERRRRSRERRSLSGSGRSHSKDKNLRLKERRSCERKSRSRRRGLSRSRRKTRSRDRSSRSRRRNRSKSRDKRSRSQDKRKRSRSRERRSRSRGRKAHSRSRERRSSSKKHGGRSQSSRDKRSRSHTRRERSQTNSKDRSESKDKKSKKEHEHHGTSKIKLCSRSKSLEKKSETRSNSSDKKSRSSSKQKRFKSSSRSSSKDNEEEKHKETNAVEELEASDKNVSLVKSSNQCSSAILVGINNKGFSRSKSNENRSSSEKEIDTKTSSEKSPDRSSQENSVSPLSFSNNSVPDPKQFQSRSVSKFIVDANSSDKKSKSPDTKAKRSRTKSPDTKPKKSRSKSPDLKARRSRSKSRDKQKIKEKRAKSKDRSRSKEVKSKAKARKSRSRERKSKTEDKLKSQRKRSRTRSKSKEKSKLRDKRSRSRERRSKSRDKKSRRSRSRSRRRKSDKKDRSRRTRSRSKSRSRKRSKKSRSRSRSKDEFFIDKSKLLEIARKNALSMMKQGAVGTDLNKVTAITAGGKTVDELTDFCKLLSQKDATGQESVSSESSSENESEKPFHHPFQLKERSNNIIMNIRNCASLPVKTHLEKTTENAQQLRLQFPVSSGQLHRKSENEWVPVSPKKTDELKAIMPAPLRKQEEELPLYPGLQETAHFSNIPLPNSIPHSQPHLPTLPQTGNSWPKPHDSGLFTGTTGARFLSQAELASGQQAWAKKDQLISAQPVSGGMGMSLLQKMGWKPGEGLGKRNEGTLEPLKLQVKMDKRGLVCADEIPQPRFRPHHIPKNQPAKSLEGKHPVSLLVEYCTRKHFNPPMFTVLSEDGPAHKKNFVFKVTVNGVDYQPPNPSPNKKQAKSEAAVLCLRALGLLPTT